MTAHVLVTGGAGFIGSHLVERLLAEGRAVRVLDNFAEGREANLAFASKHGDRLEVVRGDVRDLATVERAVQDVDVVFHQAAMRSVPRSVVDPLGANDNNVTGTLHVLEAARRHGVKRVVYASSSSVYGDAETYPTTEDMTPRPVSPYGMTKLAAEHLCEIYRTTSGVPTVSLRLFTVYGPRQRPDMAFTRLVEAALSGDPFLLYGDGTQSRDFTYVRDVVTAMRQAALSPWAGVANIGGGSRTTMLEVIEKVQALAGPIHLVRLPSQRGDVKHTAADTTVARKGFGYHPRTTLDQGLAQMVDAARLGWEQANAEPTARTEPPAASGQAAAAEVGR